MNQKFQSAVHYKEDITYVKLAGVIDEDNDLADVGDQVRNGTAVIDLSEIERINSCGVRDWVNWLNKIESRGSRVVLVECSPAIVAQINLVNNFTGTGVVKSFFAPYFCPTCDREKVLLLETSELGTTPTNAPTCRCDECDGVMEFDDMEDSYFAFLSTAQRSMDFARIQAVVEEFSPAEGEKSKIRSRVGSTISSPGGGITTLPSVPSLPSIARTNSSSFTPTPLPAKPGSQPNLRTAAGSQPSLRPRPGSGIRPSPHAIPQSGVRAGGASTLPSGISFGKGGDPSQSQVAPPSQGGALVYVLVAVLLAAIGVLAFLIFSDWPLKAQ